MRGAPKKRVPEEGEIGVLIGSFTKNIKSQLLKKTYKKSRRRGQDAYGVPKKRVHEEGDMGALIGSFTKNIETQLFKKTYKK